MATLEFHVADQVRMSKDAPESRHDTTNGLSRIISEALGKKSFGSRWGGENRKMEVMLGVPDDLVEECRAKLQAALDAGLDLSEVSEKQRPVVKVQVAATRQAVRSCDDGGHIFRAPICDDGGNSDW